MGNRESEIEENPQFLSNRISKSDQENEALKHRIRLLFFSLTTFIAYSIGATVYLIFVINYFRSNQQSYSRASQIALRQAIDKAILQNGDSALIKHFLKACQYRFHRDTTGPPSAGPNSISNECVQPRKSTIVQTAISIKTGCPAGWYHSRRFKSCYKSVYNVNFDEATAICHSVNAELITVDNDLKNLLVLQLTKADKMIDLFHGNVIIGAKKGDNDTLIWSNGKPNAYKRWSPREPNGGNVERCVNMYTDETIGYKGDLSGISRWNDFPCGQRQRVALCEMNISK